MIGATVKGLLGRKLRTALTALAIVLGVAMIAGAFITTDTMLKASDDLKQTSYGSADAVVSGRTAFKASDDNGPPVSERKAAPDTLVKTVQGVPQVAFASGEVTGDAKLTDKKGKVVDTNGSPAFAVGFDAASPSARALSPFKVKTGNFPSKPTEVAIDKQTADKKHYKVGDSVGVVSEQGIRQFTLSGVVTFGNVASIGSASAAVFSVRGAQQLFNREGKVDSILVKGKPGVPAGEVRQAIGR